MVSVAFKQNLKEKYGIKFNNEKLLEDARILRMLMSILVERTMKN